MNKLTAILLCMMVVCSSVVWSDTNVGGGCTGNCGDNGNSDNGGNSGSNGNNGNNGSNGSNGLNGQNGLNGSNGDGVSSSSSVDQGDSYSYSAPSLSAERGTETAQLGSVFGSISVSNTEDYSKVSTQSRVVVALYQADLIDRSTAKKEATEILDDLRGATKPKRFLSFGWKTRGKHLFNLFGILATDSARG